MGFRRSRGAPPAPRPRSQEVERLAELGRLLLMLERAKHRREEDMRVGSMHSDAEGGRCAWKPHHALRIEKPVYRHRWIEAQMQPTTKPHERCFRLPLYGIADDGSEAELAQVGDRRARISVRDERRIESYVCIKQYPAR